MGGFTTVKLRDVSEENIAAQNKRLRELGVNKKYKFYSDEDTAEEYEWFKKGKGVFPEHLFPRDQIKTYADFQHYWYTNTKWFGCEVGVLSFDCYFGRTSRRAMRGMGKYIAENHNIIAEVGGSFETFMERGMTRLEREIIANSTIKGK